MYIVTIDSGTTNTRVRVWNDQQVIAEAAESIGVRDTAITGNTDKLLQAIVSAFNRALMQAGVDAQQPLLILASGMITSNLGLCEIPHLIAPVSFSALAANMAKRVIPQISTHPIWFIPGVKNHLQAVDVDDCEMMDMMRGEEVETVGVLASLSIPTPALVVLPGSHSKFVKVDENQQITACTTTIAGELLEVMTKQTIISNSLSNQFAASIDEHYLLKGAQACETVGLARSGFLIRILDLFADATTNQRANYLLGAVLYSDLQTIKHSRALNITADISVVVTGKQLLREALSLLIKHDPFFTGKLIVMNEQQAQPLSGIGAITLAKMANLLTETTK